ncbi:MAG: FtsW/RodA/SpoVE family cell cycle protein [Candidatus Dojkabacteria bacterium]|nr:FtsW/RodA/SpoVE family cell cycle protein [Candidatus Dojkabacteria bacterium]
MSIRKAPLKNRIKFAIQGHRPDLLILGFAILMTLFGAMMIFDASVYKANTIFQDQFYFLKLQILWIVIGGILATIVYFIDYRKILKFSLPLLIITIVLLITVLIIGEATNGSKRWISLGPLPPIQPAEIAKLTMIFYLSNWISKRTYKYSSLKSAIKEGFLKNMFSFVAILLVVATLIIFEPDLGTTVIIFLTSFAMFLMAGNDKTHFFGSIATILFIFPLGILAIILEPYRLERVKTFFSMIITGDVADPRGSGYQMQQILIGIGSGGLLGKGFGQSRQRFGYLVENTAFTDSIFAIVLEELGLLGGAIIIIFWLGFLWRGIRVTLNAPDREGRLLAGGITIWLTLQTLLNIAANVGLVPLTGIPIPFLTYGGSSTIVTLIGIAILLNISRFTKTNEK